MNFLDLESDPRLLSVTYKKVKLWMLLRIKVSLKIKEEELDYNSNFRSRNLFRLIKNLFYGLSNIFILKRFEYLFFSNTEKRRVINGKFYDIYFDKFADIYGQERSLFIEFTETKPIPKKNIYSSHSISDLFFKAGGFFFSLFINYRKVENVKVLADLFEKHNIDLNIKANVKSLLGEYYFYRFILKYMKPKYIYVFCYYSKLPLTAAAKSLYIPVYEAQHGVVADRSEFYHTCLHSESGYFPDIFLTFGTGLKQRANKYFIYTEENISPMGSFYLDYIKSSFTDEYLGTLRKMYTKVVCVTLQRIYITEIMSFVKKHAKKYGNVLFVVRPKGDEDINKYISDNIVLLPQYDIYQVLKYCDFNLTIFSMVAIEAAYYGVYNVLYNINNMSTKYLDSPLGGEFLSVGDDMDFLDGSKTFNNFDSSEYFVDNYDRRVKEFCSEFS